MVVRLWMGMAAGGMYDHIGGGFARYSTDERWLVPHFEKMLYDNALLDRTYLEAVSSYRMRHTIDVVTEVLNYMRREMTDPEGGFYSATDADSEGVEGKFFVWTPEEVAQMPSATMRTPAGFAPVTTLRRRQLGAQEYSQYARSRRRGRRELNVSLDELRRPLIVCGLSCMRLEATGASRPGRQNLTAWNGMMISAMAEAARVLGPAGLFGSGRRSGPRFSLADDDTVDDRLIGRLEMVERISTPFWRLRLLGEGLVDLYEAGGDEGYFEAARLAERLSSDFSDTEHGGFFTTAKDHER